MAAGARRENGERGRGPALRLCLAAVALLAGYGGQRAAAPGVVGDLPWLQAARRARGRRPTTSGAGQEAAQRSARRPAAVAQPGDDRGAGRRGPALPADRVERRLAGDPRHAHDQAGGQRRAGRAPAPPPVRQRRVAATGPRKTCSASTTPGTWKAPSAVSRRTTGCGSRGAPTARRCRRSTCPRRRAWRSSGSICSACRDLVARGRTIATSSSTPPPSNSRRSSGTRWSMRHRVIVGKPERQTPTVRATIKALNFFPYWRVPESVADARPHSAPREGARLPAAGAHPRADRLLQRTRDRSLRRSIGATSTPTGCRFRQDPGPQNALGLVRIDMPNERWRLHARHAAQAALQPARPRVQRGLRARAGRLHAGGVDRQVRERLGPAGACPGRDRDRPAARHAR